MEILALLADTAEEGRNIILVMLVTGLVFVMLVLLGNWFRALTHRKRH
ncbi:MAG: hypothetical protein ICV64_04275 [Thermoleophilia bacterium]|nr:hypothetical protein [Thermoleophilia bacterium]